MPLTQKILEKEQLEEEIKRDIYTSIYDNYHS